MSLNKEKIQHKIKTLLRISSLGIGLVVLKYWKVLFYCNWFLNYTLISLPADLHPEQSSMSSFYPVSPPPYPAATTSLLHLANFTLYRNIGVMLTPKSPDYYYKVTERFLMTRCTSFLQSSFFLQSVWHVGENKPRSKDDTKTAYTALDVCSFVLYWGRRERVKLVCCTFEVKFYHSILVLKLLKYKDFLFPKSIIVQAKFIVEKYEEIGFFLLTFKCHQLFPREDSESWDLLPSN